LSWAEQQTARTTVALSGTLKEHGLAFLKARSSRIPTASVWEPRTVQNSGPLKARTSAFLLVKRWDQKLAIQKEPGSALRTEIRSALRTEIRSGPESGPPKARTSDFLLVKRWDQK
jgi:hypothetical protein